MTNYSDHAALSLTFSYNATARLQQKNKIVQIDKIALKKNMQNLLSNIANK